MKCTANYGVVYRGVLYSAGETFDIASEHSAEMSAHGKVWSEEPKHDASAEPLGIEQPVVKRSPGRSRKNPT